MDLEGFVRRSLKKNGKRAALRKLTRLVGETKGIPRGKARRIAEAVIGEVLASQKPTSGFLKKLLASPRSGVSMGDAGVGCRGEGDFFVHRCIAGIPSLKPFVGPAEQDDAGGVKRGGLAILVSVDGTHSRLSEFPFLAGFHVTRAALRDVLVKGAEPVALFTDVHLADDGDVGKLFDFSAGISAVSELSGVPLVAGSTLRVGGDMVIGDRMVSCVGAVGIAKAGRVALRSGVREGDSIIMTEGAGGGTVCTAAIYGGEPKVALETLNVDFIRACKALAPHLKRIHCMADVTNGGIRGDANEIEKVSGVGMVLEEEAVRRMVNQRVLRLLEGKGIDYLGISLDSLLVFTPEPQAVLRALEAEGLQAAVVGKAGGKGCWLERSDGMVRLAPLYRESAYTEIKKLVGEKKPVGWSALKRKIKKAAREAVRKKNAAIDFIKRRG